MVHPVPKQRFIIQQKVLTISSPKADYIQYSCVNSSSDERVEIKIGLNALKTVPGCHYETSELQIRNAASITSIIHNRLLDPSLLIAKDLSNINSLLDSDFDQSLNLTALKNKINLYGSDLQLTDKTVEEVSRNVNDLETLRIMAKYDPTALNFSQLSHSANWLTTIFWLVIIIILVMTWKCIMKTRWYHNIFRPALITCYACLGQACARLRNVFTHGEPRDEHTGEPFISRQRTSNGPEQRSVRFRPHSLVESLSISEPLSTIFMPAIPQEEEASNLWHPIQGKYGNWQLEKKVRGPQGAIINVFYDTDRNLVVTADGKTAPSICPPNQLSISYLNSTIIGSRPTSSVIIDDKICHKEFNHLIYNRETHKWIDTERNAQVSGLPLPKHVVPDIL
jgi:hypothetical protein